MNHQHILIENHYCQFQELNNRNEFQNLSQDELPGEVNDVLTIMDPGEENSELLVLQICSISLLVGDRLQLCMILKILTCRMTNID